MNYVKFDKYNLTHKSKPLFIAEAAVEHLGSLEVAKRMVDAAKYAGADIIKFQMHLPEEEMLKDKIKFWGGSLDEILRNYNLSIQDHINLIDYCKKKKITYLCTPFCPKAVKILNKLKVNFFKTGSGEMLNLPLMDEIKKTKKPVIISTGMSNKSEIDFIYNYMKKDNVKFILMNCTSIYPSPYDKINLNFIEEMRERYKIFIGHSDHTPDIWSSLGAIAKGAKVIEKHFTLNRKLKGPDYEVSLEPNEFKTMVDAGLKIFKSLGTTKKIYSEELVVQKWARHSIVAIENIKKNQKLNKKNLSVKRPGNGIPASMLKNIIGKKSKRSIKKNTFIKYSDIL
jgi:sialic acid synthase SpsE